MTTLNVAIIGHSQVPPELISPNINCKIFRKPGARLSNWQDVPELVDVLNHNFDLVFIWLGSNDITTDCRPNLILHQLTHCARQVESRCQCKVVLVEVEHRCYTQSRHYVPPTQYLHIRRAINKRLHLQRRHTLLSFGALRFELARDGVHFRPSSKEMIKQKFVTYIERFRAGNLI